MNPSTATLHRVLRIDASLQTSENSSSRQLAEYLLAQLAPQHIEQIDLAQINPQPIDGEFLAAMMTDTPHSNSHLALANRWIEQVQQADALVISVPMYNFGMPAQLKTFFDYILRAGVTFRYTENGPQGLLRDKPVYLILASGGDYRQGEAAKLNYLDGHLKTLLNFIGLTDLHFIHAAGLAMGEPEQIMIQAQHSIDALVA
ncbi:FMN-dependent NADH-azoreductase [Thiosulfatimonas sediminis]|uniref:FMN dependent NADH:quinone oxidoreductase n=1 Tax=Thiosulfatimonas sediminis TaxID=2675054 RepID=A0A6F8PY68_9GAMM|nr:NAD(P)H-dependent oxidoreductase [Thiosulfatimonas sediminis]BBP47046.1 FMN-dependent NADH-azoreductase [Thiosulfatimonas sediminis]